MKATGVTRSLDHLGRIVIPVEIRRNFEIKENDPLEIYVEDDRIILQKYKPRCTFCGNDCSLTEFNGKHLCAECIQQLKDI